MLRLQLLLLIILTIILIAAFLIFLFYYFYFYSKIKKRQGLNKKYEKAIRWIKRGDLDKALQILKEALEMCNSIKDKKNICAADVMQKIALIYKIKGEYKEALAYYKKALVIKKVAKGDSHAEVIRIEKDIEITKKAMKNKKEK